MAIFFHGCTAILGLGLIVVEVSRLHRNTPQWVVILWTSDRPIAETSTWQHTHNTHKRQTSMPRWDSNPQSQQASGSRPTP